MPRRKKNRLKDQSPRKCTEKDRKHDGTASSSLAQYPSTKHPFVTASRSCPCGCICHDWSEWTNPRRLEPWEYPPSYRARRRELARAFANSSRSPMAKQEQDLVEGDEEGKEMVMPAILGGSSWEGALPGAILAGLCRERGWRKPRYAIEMASKNRYVASIVIQKLAQGEEYEDDVEADENAPSIHIQPPPSLKHSRFICSTSFEACNITAAYVLFRLCSSRQDVCLSLPPPIRDYLWRREFAKLRVMHVAEGKEWMYDENPLA